MIIRNVLQHVEQKDHVEFFLQCRIPLEDVVAAHLAAPAYILLQRVLIQIETRHLACVRILDLSLEQSSRCQGGSRRLLDCGFLLQVKVAVEL